MFFFFLKLRFFCAIREIPECLEPLRPHLVTDCDATLLGVDPDSCLVFLGHNYSAESLPEVPSPQTLADPLPYTCIVATPRKEVSADGGSKI